eukprot:TRINITY_DN6179_c0_g2_i2.p1 TRINITY_DN6179_c0_g2~~TRINITY_DN6179_c0_g2_i2.p1  ORF type:complete len:560 (+),score=160.67 TRINITY_DN6179_c0_g2_i2:71-1750(+)
MSHTDRNRSGSSTAKTDKVVLSSDANDYDLTDLIGSGSTSKVWKAMYKPTQTPVAVKLFNLEFCSRDMEELRNEIQFMKSMHHKNIVNLLCSFTQGEYLWLVMDLLDAGSILDIVRHSHERGIQDEAVIATVLKHSLQGIEYLHKTGHIHRDIKCGNILLSRSGRVQISDFGVSAMLVEQGERKCNRQTFVGTPCWMAPEVMEQVDGYNYSADIWSFGITALEMAHGSAPLSQFSPMQVLQMTLQNPPPTLSEGEVTNGKYSRVFKDMVDLCLQKAPSKRPTASKLLQHRFFKLAKSPEYLISNLLNNLPMLGDRLKKHRDQILSDAETQSSSKKPSSGGWIFEEGVEPVFKPAVLSSTTPASAIAATLVVPTSNSSSAPSLRSSAEARKKATTTGTGSAAGTSENVAGEKVVTRKGRFKVTSETSDGGASGMTGGASEKRPSGSRIARSSTSSDGKTSTSSTVLQQHLKTLLQQTTQQRKMIQALLQSSNFASEVEEASTPPSESPMQLLLKLQARLTELQVENERLKLMNMQLKAQVLPQAQAQAQAQAQQAQAQAT